MPAPVHSEECAVTSRQQRDDDFHDVVRMGKDAIQKQQNEQKQMVSPFQSPDAAVHLPADASAAVSRLPPQPVRPSPTPTTFMSRVFGCTCVKAPAVREGQQYPIRAPSPSLQAGPLSSVTRSLSRHSGGSLTHRWSGLKTKDTANSFTDAEWFDALSDVSWTVGDQEPIPRALMPDPPLYFQDRPMAFTTIPAQLPHAGYWLRDEQRTTPFPQPIDLMLGANWIVKKVHASIPGIYLYETATTLEVRVHPRFMPPGLGRYSEVYNKDGSESTWMMRRDLQPGRSYGRMYLTTDGVLVFRVHTKPLFSDVVDTICEEYNLVEMPPAAPQQQGEGVQPGQQQQQQQPQRVIVTRQCCYDVASGRTATQYLVGSYLPEPPKGHAW